MKIGYQIALRRMPLGVPAPNPQSEPGRNCRGRGYFPRTASQTSSLKSNLDLRITVCSLSGSSQENSTCSRPVPAKTPFSTKRSQALLWKSQKNEARNEVRKEQNYAKFSPFALFAPFAVKIQPSRVWRDEGGCLIHL